MAAKNLTSPSKNSHSNMDKLLVCQPAYKKQKMNDKPEDKESVCKCNELSSKASENTHNEKKKQDAICSDDDKIATEDSEMTDTHYFRCYADLSVHRVMIGDFERTHAYRKAILSNYKLFHKKVVADVGAGTGILSIFCAQAGAKRVYAIEASSVAEEARKVVAANGLSDRITVIQEKVEMVSLPEKVDVIVSEWMGYMLMYESMLPSLLHARDQWLKEGGLLFPDEVNMYLAPISDYQQYEYSVDFWNKVDDMYKVDMSVLAETAAQQLQEFVHVVSVDPSSVQAHASCLARIKLSSVEAAMTDCIQGSFMCSCFGSTIVHGFVIWFTVHFPSSVTLSTSPFENETHWEQSVLYIPPIAVEQNTLLNGRLSIKRNTNYHRFLDVDLEYQVNDGERKSQTYKMKD